jgi:hypothetical protein
MSGMTYYRAWGQDPRHYERSFQNEADAIRYAEELAPNSCGYAFLEIVGKKRELKLYSASKQRWCVDSDDSGEHTRNSDSLGQQPSSVCFPSTYRKPPFTFINSPAENSGLLNEQARLDAVLYDRRDVDTLARSSGCRHDKELCDQCFEAGERRWQMASIRRGLEENEKRLRTSLSTRNETLQGDTPRVRVRSSLRRVREDRESARMFEEFCRSKVGFCEQWQYT